MSSSIGQRQQLELVVTARYSPALAGGRRGQRAAELYPTRVHVYMSHEARDVLPQTFVFDDASSRHVFQFTVPLVGKSDERQVYAPFRDAGAYESFATVGRVFQPGKLSRSTSLRFNAYATTYTEAAEQGFTCVGTTAHSVLELLALAEANVTGSALTLLQNTTNLPDDACRDRSAPIRPRNDVPLVKGAIELQRVAVRNGTVADARALFLNVSPAYDLNTLEQQQRAQTAMRDVADRELAVFFGARARLGVASLPVLRRFHTVEYRMNEFFTPFIGYVLQRPPAPAKPGTIEYLYNAASVVLARRAFDIDALLAAGDSMFAAHRESSALGVDEFALLSFVGSVMMLLANTIGYMDDCNNRNVCGAPWQEALIEIDEDNKPARMLGLDDCEGVGKEIYLCVTMALEVLPASADDVPASGARAPLVHLGILMRRVLRQYVPCLALCAASNNRLTADAGTLSADSALAHTFCLLMPYALFARLDQNIASRTARTQSRFYAERAIELNAMQCSLPVLICEGTASMECTALPADAYYTASDEATRSLAPVAASVVADASKRAAFVQRSIANTRLQTTLDCFARRTDSALLANKCDLSTFYKWIAALTTGAFADKRRVAWAIVQKHINPETYCATFNDFMLDANRFRLEPILELSVTEVATIDNLLATTEPMPPLDVAPQLSSGAQSLLTSLRVRIDAAIDGSGRQGQTAEKRGADTPIHRRRLPVYTRVQDVGAREIRALETLAAYSGWSTRPTLEAYRIAAPPLPGLPAYEIVELMLEF